MSYTIRKLKLTENEKNALNLLPQEMREDIGNGYYPFALDAVLPVISKKRKLTLEVNGDYGHYVELWENGKKKKTVNAEKALREYIKTL